MIGSYGSKYKFGFHSDNPLYKIYPEYERNSLNSPQFLSLFCLRGKAQVFTDLILLDDVLGLLEGETVHKLSKNEFVVKSPDSFDKQICVENVSVIQERDGTSYTRFDFHNVKGMNKEANLALDKFKHATEHVKKLSHCFQKGDFLIFKNQETLHSRDSFEAKFDGFDRWLIRLYGANSYDFLDNNEIVLHNENVLNENILRSERCF